jgi:hypothetical protein
MGEVESTAERFSFNRSVRFEGRGHRLTGDAGALLLRELDEKLDLSKQLRSRLDDPRNEDYIQYPLIDLVRSRLYGLALGKGRQDQLADSGEDPALRLAVSSKAGLSPLDGSLASQATFSRLDALLSTTHNLAALQDGLVDSTLADLELRQHSKSRALMLDVDSVALEVFGQQEGSAYNGHYGMRCYHPLVAFLGETGHCVGAWLRPGNAHTADGTAHRILPVVSALQKEGVSIAGVRGDAGFPSEPLLAALEREEIPYVFRIRGNTRLHALAAPFVRPPRGRKPTEPREWVVDLTYAAEQWSRNRRVVLVLVERPHDLFAIDSFFLVTSWSPSEKRAATLLSLYRQRGTMEKHLGCLLSAIDPRLSSTNRPKSHVRGQLPAKRADPCDPEAVNAAHLLLVGLAHNLLVSAAGIANTAARPHRVDSTKRVRELLLSVPGRLAVSARRAILVVNEAVAEAWTQFLRRLGHLAPT